MKLHDDLNLHQQGLLKEAKAIYEALLVKENMNADVIHYLGIIEYQIGNYEKAVELIQKVIDLKPNFVGAYSNLGNALMNLNILDKALESYNLALSIQPNHIPTLVNKGNLLQKIGETHLAIKSYDEAIKLSSKLPEVFYNKGNALKDLERFEDAIVNYNSALKIRPTYAECYCNKGSILKKLGRLDDALLNLNKAIELKPKYYEAYSTRGNILKELKNFNLAIDSYEKAININPLYSEAYFNKAVVLHEINQIADSISAYEVAIKINSNDSRYHFSLAVALKQSGKLAQSLVAFDTALNLNPSHVDAYLYKAETLGEMGLLLDALETLNCAKEFNINSAELEFERSNLLMQMYRIEDAIESYERAIEINPEHAEAWNNKGVAHKELGQVSKAIESYNQAIAVKPEYADAYWNKSLASLLKGDFETGWQLYEWRWKSKDLSKDSRSFTQPLWLGKEPLFGKTVLLHSEQGLGDTLQFCRFATLVKGLGAKVVLEVPKSLIELLKTLDGVDHFVAKGESLPEFDLHCPLMSLPLALNIRPETMSLKVPYVYAQDEKIKKWSAYIGSQGFKIAIAWQGRPDSKVDAGRSFPVELFEEISKIEGVRLISLQKNAGAEQLSTLPQGMKVEQLPEDFDANGDAFLDSAAVMNCVDLVISSDTALTHLAGAMGVKTWLPLKTVPDWRWLLEGQSGPWYPNHTLFRQKNRGVWTDVFEQMNLELKNLITINIK